MVLPAAGQVQAEKDAPQGRKQITIQNRQVGPIQIQFRGNAGAQVRVIVNQGQNAKPARQQPDVERVEEEPLEREIKDEKPENPLGRLLRGIFQKPRGRMIPKSNPAEAEHDHDHGEEAVAGEEGEKKEEIPDLRNVRDWVDRCAPHEYRLEKLLSRVQRNLKLGARTIALEQLQQILDLPNGRISVGPGESKLIRDEIHRIIASLPKESRDEYELQYGAIAQQALEAAQKTSGLASIADVADRYLNTKAGQKAANQLASAHIDRGQWIPAAQWYQRLLTVAPEKDRVPVWYLKAAITFEQAGLKKEAQQMLSELEGLQAIQAGDTTYNPQDLWLQMVNLESDRTDVLRDWPMIQGTPNRSAVTRGEFPVLIPRWRLPSTQSTLIRDQIAELTRDLRESGQVPLPAARAIHIGNLTIVRTMQGVAVVDTNEAASHRKARPRWQTRQGYSPERLMTGFTNLGAGLFEPNSGRNGGSRTVSPYEGSNAANHQLTGLLFRDGIYGIVSGDRERLYVIEKQAWMPRYRPGYYSTNNNIEVNDPLKRDFGSNRLAAYDLQTGRIRWEIGGPEFQERFELPLAGNYFFGAPLVDGENLYIVGEKENDIRLFCLEARTGHPRWDVLIGHSLHNPTVDIGRRWWTAQPALVNGMLVCPNTTGWLLGIDTTTHSVIWEARFREVQQNNRSEATRFRSSRNSEGLVQNRSLNDEWRASAPVILGDRVLYTPPETSDLVCHRLIDGKQLWKIPRGEMLALIHADRSQMIALTTSGLKCLSLEDRKQLWEYAVEPPLMPSGRPAVTPTEVFLPLVDGSLHQVNRETGKLVQQRSQFPGAEPLGNLSFHGDLLVSVTGLGATAFDLSSAFHAKLEARLKGNPNDPWSLLQQAELQRLEGNQQAALALLERIDASELSEADRERHRDVLFATLSEWIEREPDGPAERLQKLQDLAQTPAERWRVEQLDLRRLTVLGKYREAFDRHLQIAEEYSFDRLITEQPRNNLRIRFSLWLVGGLSEILDSAPAELREELEREIQEMTRKTDPSDKAACEKIFSLFPDLASTAELRIQLARRAAEQDQLTQAEYHYRELLRPDSRETAARAGCELLQMYARLGRRTAAEDLRTTLIESFPDVRIGGQALSEYIASLDLEARLKESRLPDRDWGVFDLEVRQRAMNSQIMQQYQYKMMGEPMPLMPDVRYDFNRESRRLVISTSDEPDDIWSVPLRSGSYLSHRRSGIIDSLGHVMLILQSNSLTAISPLERKVLWSRPLKSNIAYNGTRSYSSYGSSIPSMEGGNSLLSQHGVLARSQQHPIVALSEDMICIRSERDLQAYHPVTGDLLWTMEKIPNNTRIVADEKTIYLFDEDENGRRFRLNLSDGRQKPLSLEQQERVEQAVALIDGDAITVQTRRFRTLFLQNKTVLTLKRVNIQTGETRWEWEGNADSLLSVSKNRIYELNRKQKELAEVDLRTGQRRQLASLDAQLPASVREAFTIESGNRIYLVVNDSRNNNAYRNYYLDSVNVNGKIHAINRAKQELVWSKTVEKQHLLLDVLHDSPVLVFAARTNQRIGNRYLPKQYLLALDAGSGRELINTESAFNSNFQAVHLNHTDHVISLMSYNIRLMLKAVPPEKGPLRAPRPAPSISDASEEALPALGPADVFIQVID
jgi:outer membrane protein assembly factor BamB